MTDDVLLFILMSALWLVGFFFGKLWQREYCTPEKTIEITMEDIPDANFVNIHVAGGEFHAAILLPGFRFVDGKLVKK